MLFDLRSRKRRTAVRIIYSGLAVVMVGGLILFGIGTGGGGGGLLNSGSGSGSGNSQTASQVQKAKKETEANPDSAAAWGNLFQAQMINALSGANVTGTANKPTKSGVVALGGAANSWQKYLQLTHEKPDSTKARQAAQMYATLALTGSKTGWSNATSTWQYVITGTPSNEPSALVLPYQCAAVTAYADGQTSTGDLAAAQAKAMAKKAKTSLAGVTALDSALSASKKSKSQAAEYALTYCSTIQSAA